MIYIQATTTQGKNITCVQDIYNTNKCTFCRMKISLKQARFKLKTHFKIFISTNSQIQRIKKVLRRFQYIYIYMQSQVRAIKNTEEEDLLKLEKEIKEIEEWKELETIEEEIIKDYKMEEGEYNILISIYEGSELIPKPDNFFIINANKSHCNAFVEVEINGVVRKTKVRKETNNPIFDEHFYMNFKYMTKEDLENAFIKMTVYDRSALIIKKSILGTVEIDWTNVYFRRNHEIYRGWLTLTDPSDEVQGPVGYLLVNIAVLGVHDKIMVHDSSFIKNPLTTIEDTITIKKLRLMDFAINIEVYRAEHIVPLDRTTGTCSPFVVAKFSGAKVRTSKINSLNPEWNQMLKIGTKIPTKSKFITIEVWDHNLINDELIGVVRIPFTEICGTQNVIGPRWFNLYGPPLSGFDIEPYNHFTKMQVFGDEIGSHYRGRLLLKLQGIPDVFTKTSKQKMKFKFPFKPVPNIPQKNFTLRAYVFEGVELPEVKKHCCVHIQMGPYLMASTKKTPALGVCNWYQKLEDKKVMFPYQEGNVDQLPDLIIYYASGDYEKERMSYVRIKASQIFCKYKDTEILTLELKEDKSLDLVKDTESGGYLTVKLELFDTVPPIPIDPSTYKVQKEIYELRLYLYMGQNLPPVNTTGDTDPYIKFRCYGSEEKSESKKSQINPIWNKIITMNVAFEDIFTTVSSKGVMCSLLDEEDDGNDKFIGRFWLPIHVRDKVQYKPNDYSNPITILHHKPRWFNVKNQAVNINKMSLGKILLGYSLIRKADLVKIPPLLPDKSISIGMDERNVHIFIVGLRGADSDVKWDSAKVVVTFSGAVKSIKSASEKIRNGGCTFNSLFEVDLKMPHNRNLTPFMDVRIYNLKGNKTQFLGFASKSIYELLPRLLKTAGQSGKKKITGIKVEPIKEEPIELEDSEDTILNVERLEHDIDVIKLRRKKAQQLGQKDNSEDHKKKKVSDLPVPNELAGGVRDVQEWYRSDFDKLLEDFDTDLEVGPEYDYVRELEKKNDAKQSVIRNSRIEGKEFNPQQKEDQNIEEGRLMAQNFSEREGRKDLRTANQNITNLAPVSNKVFEADRKLAQQKLENQSEKARLKDEHELRTVFNYPGRAAEASQQANQDVRVMNNLELMTNDAISVAHSSQTRAIKYQHIEKAYNQEKEHEQLAREREKQYKYAAAVKLTLFSWRKKKRQAGDIETYQDYDTDPEENLDITPEWYKGRKIMSSDFEDHMKPTRKLIMVDIFSGGSNSKDVGMEEIRVIKKLATLKFVALLSEDPQELRKKEKYYNRLLTPRTYMCRLYFLKGKSLISQHRGSPTTYLKITYGNKVFDLKKTTLAKDQRNPEYFVCQEIAMDLPGPSTVKVEVMEQYSYFSDKSLGYTEIDIQNRFLTKKWHLFFKKPIELRNLYSEYGSGSQGRLQTWVDLIERKDWQANPAQKIHPPPYDEYELRVIVWSTKDCVYKDEAEECNDVFVRGFIGTSDPQETDTHWRCRGTGSFNWRFKFPVWYPPKPEEMYSDQLTIQIWDKDVIGYNDLIGEARINLNKIHRIIEKVVIRKKPTKASMKVIEKGMDIVDKFYFDVYNDKQLDEFGNKVSQGRVQLSFELVPIKEAKEKLENGLGRAEPNLYPTLQEPTGRLSFNWLHPFQFLKELMGERLYNKVCRYICLFLVIIILGAAIYVIGGGIIANLIVR